MPITGYLKIPDIEGESVVAGHEDEIDVQGISWSIERAGGATTGRGRARGRAEAGPLVMLKVVDKATPYLALAVAQGKAFDEIVFTADTLTGGARIDYFQMKMKNCVLIGAAVHNEGLEDPLEIIRERIEIAFEKLTITYIEFGDDGSSQGTHEVDIDLAAGE